MLLDLVAKPTFVYHFKRLSVGRSLIDSPAFRAIRSLYPPGQTDESERAKQSLAVSIRTHAFNCGICSYSSPTESPHPACNENIAMIQDDANASGAIASSWAAC